MPEGGRRRLLIFGHAVSKRAYMFGMLTVPKTRRYYSTRTGADPNGGSLDFETLRALFHAVFKQLAAKGYLQEVFGYYCVDSGFNPGTAGEDAKDYVYLHTRKFIWPVGDQIMYYEEADLFDLIEFLYDNISKPVSGWMHSFGDCGMHWDNFDRAAGQAEFREAISNLLEGYGLGYELSELGEIMERAPKGMGKLLKASPPIKDSDALSRMNAAIDRFQRYRSSLDDRRHAVRDLADVLEKLRPHVKEALNRQDEADLFNLANNFGIRHLNERQKADYDPAVWLSWMFYFYLATINACLHILERKAKGSG